MYSIIISKTFKKKFDKLPNQIQNRARKLLKKLEVELIGESLVGDLKGLYSIHFEKNKYRIIYSKQDNNVQILLLDIGKRNDSFYDTFRKNRKNI